MQLPLQITFRDIHSSPTLAEHIHRRAAKLDGLCERLTSCRVALESPNRHTASGRHFHVRVDVTLPGAELVAGKHHANQLDNDPHVAIDRAFDEAERLLCDRTKRVRVQRRKAGPPRQRPSTV